MSSGRAAYLLTRTHATPLAPADIRAMIRRMKNQSQRPLYRCISQASLGLALLLLTLLTTAVPQATSAPLAQMTPTGIQAEAVGQANVRAGPGLDYAVIGTIFSGTRYAVFGQHEFFPWLLIAYPGSADGQGWVFADLVTLTAPLAQVPYLSGTILVSTPSPIPVATLTALPGNVVTSDPALAGLVTVEALAETNVRFGPGVDYPRIGRIFPGERYTALSRHALYPWLLISFPGAPNGAGWVYMDVVEVTGDVSALPVITVETVGWPTLTPTPPFVITSLPPWQNAETPAPTPMLPAIDLPALGDDILAYLLEQGFAPEEDRFGSVFLLDLATGANISLGDGIAYSGMSLIKIPILVTLYRQLDRPPDPAEAITIANTMICSDNMASNELLARIGGGDPYTGGQQVTATMRALGLQNTFILTPFVIPGVPMPQPGQALTPPQTAADQERAAPDPYNQATPEDLGWLLNAVYQCAMDESGPLLIAFPGEITPVECRQMILAMSANEIGVLTEAGVPTGTRVAHKHGWINDTHGDAAIVFTPGGDFVLTMTLHQPDWLPYELSWPTMAEIARLAYNAYNPNAPLDAIHPQVVSETCQVDASLLEELATADVPLLE